MYASDCETTSLKEGYNKVECKQLNSILNSMRDKKEGDKNVRVFQEVYLLDSLNRMYSLGLDFLKPFPSHEGTFNMLLNIKETLKPYLKEGDYYNKTRLATMGVYYNAKSNSISILHIIYAESLDMFKLDFNLVFTYSEFKERRKEVFGGN